MIIFEYDQEFGITKTSLNEDMERLFVDSSNINSFWFKNNKTGIKSTGVLSVEFKSGAVYEYYRVPEVVVDRFVGSVTTSAGRAFWRLIRGRYPYRRVE